MFWWSVERWQSTGLGRGRAGKLGSKYRSDRPIDRPGRRGIVTAGRWSAGQHYDPAPFLGFSKQVSIQPEAGRENVCPGAERYDAPAYWSTLYCTAATCFGVDCCLCTGVSLIHYRCRASGGGLPSNFCIRPAGCERRTPRKSFLGQKPPEPGSPLFYRREGGTQCK
jgi:hypothetical protein